MKHALIIFSILKKSVNTALSSLTPGFTYKSAVASASNLPSGASNGDMYIVKDEDNKRYVFDEASNAYLPLTTAITTSQIDSLYT